MRCIVSHDAQGRIRSLTTLPPDAPPISTTPRAGEASAEVDVPDDLLDVFTTAGDEGVIDALLDYRVEVRIAAKLVRRANRAT